MREGGAEINENVCGEAPVAEELGLCEMEASDSCERGRDLLEEYLDQEAKISRNVVRKIFENPGEYLKNPRLVMGLIKDTILAAGIPGLLGYNVIKSALAATVGFDAAQAVLESTMDINFSNESEVQARLTVAGLTVISSTSFYIALGMIGARLGIKRALKKEE